MIVFALSIIIIEMIKSSLVALDLTLSDFHLSLLDLLLDILANVAGKVVVQLQPLGFLRGQLCPCFLDFDNQFAFSAYKLTFGY
jgi:hypothetical protein